MSNESSAIAADAYSWRLPPNNIQHFTEAQKSALYGLILAYMRENPPRCTH